MAELNAGRWVIGLSVYFFIFFVVVTSWVGLMDFSRIDHSLNYEDTGFKDAALPDGEDSALDTIINSLSLITGIGSADVEIGVPAAYKYAFSFLFFWIELLALIYAIYMMTPFI